MDEIWLQNELRNFFEGEVQMKFDLKMNHEGLSSSISLMLLVKTLDVMKLNPLRIKRNKNNFEMKCK